MASQCIYSCSYLFFFPLLIDSHRTCAFDQRRPLSISEAAAFNEMYRAFIPIHLNSPPAKQRKDAADSEARPRWVDWKQEMDKER